MTYLLDTHYVLWSFYEPHKISADIRQILENEDDKKVVSGITFLEISIKYALGKLAMDGTNPKELFGKMGEAGFEVIPLENHLLATFYQLPLKSNHKDPFDRLLIWQAIKNGYTLITHDGKIKQYENDGLDVVIS